MEDPIQPLEVVALTVDIPELNLQRGQVGTVIDLLEGGQALEVEFSDREGRTYASLGLSRIKSWSCATSPTSGSPDRQAPGVTNDCPLSLCDRGYLTCSKENEGIDQP